MRSEIDQGIDRSKGSQFLETEVINANRQLSYDRNLSEALSYDWSLSIFEGPFDHFMLPKFQNKDHI